MMLLKMELGHIWKPKLLLVLLAAGLLYGFLFLEFPLNYFPNGHPAEEQFQLMADWSERYGIEMDEEEYQDAVERLKTELGVTDPDADGESMLEPMDTDYSEYDAQWASALYEYELRYESLNQRLEEGDGSEAERARIRDMIDHEKRGGILPYEVMGNAMEYWRWVSGFLLLSVMLLLAPTVTKDTLTGVGTLQYTSKKGRRVLQTQALAMALSAAGIVLLELLIFGGLYAGLGTLRFRNHPINSFFFGDIYWFDLTFGQFLLAILLIILLFAAGAAGITFCFSCFSRNYISLMMKVIPALIVLGVLNNMCIMYLFDFQNPLYGVTGVKGVELYLGVLVLLVGTVLGAITWRRQTRATDGNAEI